MTSETHEYRPIRHVGEDGSGHYEAACSCGWRSDVQRGFFPNADSEARAALEAQADMKAHNE